MKGLMSSVAVLALAAMAQSANATTVATIDGCYDCVVYDTPTLTFHNTSGGDFINSQIVLHAYQGLNNGTTQTVLLGTILQGNTNVNWDGAAHNNAITAGDLFSYDYDDSWGGTTNNSACILGQGLCSFVGNFDVTFSATISGGAFNGQPVFSVFSPHSNDTGGFLGWEGLDPNGLSETTYDQHNGSNITVNGTLAHIDIGFAPVGAPGPIAGAGLPGLLAGFGAMLAWYRRRRAAV